MACFFCNNLYHLTQNCDIYESDGSRIDFINEKNLCQKCFKPSSYRGDFREARCDCISSGRFYIRCYVCLSTYHSTLFCEQRFDLFVPKIDADLHSRFFKTLDSVEKYFLAFSSPKYLDLLKPKGVVAQYGIHATDITKYCNEKDILTSPWVTLDSTDDLPSNLINLLNSKMFLIHTPDLRLENIQNFPAELLLLLLTPYVKKFRCRKMTFDSTPKFSKILSKIPNAKKIELLDVQIETEKTWPEEWHKFKNGNKSKKLTLKPAKLEFDVEKLAEFMKINVNLLDDVKLDVDEISITNSTSHSIFAGMVYSELLMVEAKCINLVNLQNFSKMLLDQLFVSRPTKFSCKNVTFDCPVKFSKILAENPCLEEIELLNTDIEIEDSWLDDVLECRAQSRLTRLSMKIDNFDFDFEKLAAFMKSGMKRNVYFHLDIVQTRTIPNASDVLQAKIDKDFVPFSITKCNKPVLSITHTIINDPRSPTPKNYLYSPA